MSAPRTAVLQVINAPGPTGTRFAILALALGGFGVGTTEFASMGLLPFIAEDFGASIPALAHSISLYALGVVVGAPLITTLTSRVERKTLLLGLMAAFTVGNALSAAAPTLDWLYVARFLSGLPHGAYFGVAAVVASSLVPRERRGTAVARVALGLTVANIAGVPLAAALGGALGWRSGYGLVVLIGLLTVAALAAFVPKTRQGGGVSVAQEIRALGRPQVTLTLIAGTVGFGGMFAVYTFISPTLTELTGLSISAVPWVLAVFGVGMTLGSLLVGPLVDRSIEKTVLGAGAVSAVALVFFGLFAQWAVAAVLGVLWIGVMGSVFTTSLQMRLLREAKDAPSLTAAMNHAAFNLANAMGAFLGGAVISAGWGYRAPAWVGVGLALAGLLILAYAVRMQRSGAAPARTPARAVSSWPARTFGTLVVLLPETAPPGPAPASSSRTASWSELVPQ
ncbi:MFS transporter [Kocuria sediminis]|uniref:MFS transporter n=1 Tax=Kocuria sediminis TaxID=1038857 RepID=A0A6N8GIL5_9MICC|nr:MFS transporter [Kocuria sediminis]MUN62110.1 MFS transporter [Kocuria sediminis]